MIAVNLYVANSTPIPSFNYHVRIVWCQHKVWTTSKYIHFNPKVGFDLLIFKDSLKPNLSLLILLPIKIGHKWGGHPRSSKARGFSGMRCFGVNRCEHGRIPSVTLYWRWIGLISFSSPRCELHVWFLCTQCFFSLRGFQVYPGSQRCHL